MSPPDGIIDPQHTEPAKDSPSPWRSAIIWGLVAFAALRVTCGLAGALAPEVASVHPTPAVPGYQPEVYDGAGQQLVGVWLRGDALWYLKIATSGYGDHPGTYAFYPAFPVLVAGLQWLFGPSESIAAVVVASLAAAAGLVLFYRFLEAMGLPPGKVKAATLGFALFPTSFFLIAPYAESLFFALGVGALLASIRGKSWIAALSGALAALARPFGVLLTVPLLVLSSKRRFNVEAAGPVLGWITWQLWVASQTGNIWAGVSVQSVWQREFRFPLVTAWDALVAWLSVVDTSLGWYLLADISALVILVLLTMASWTALRPGHQRREPVAITGYGLALIIVATSYPFVGRPLLSVPRFALAGFPIFAGMSLMSRKSSVVALFISYLTMVLAAGLYVTGRPLF